MKNIDPIYFGLDKFFPLTDVQPYQRLQCERRCAASGTQTYGIYFKCQVTKQMRLPCERLPVDFMLGRK
ncbi:MAG: hypothetical protein CR984_01060 [Proteobacteria bacterium]|nr:MAG: hypothetical protein CR984_01060 [Pseudomonadota bacterium]